MSPDRVSGDPSDPGSWNKYAYTRGDPINRIDPEGLADFSVTGYCINCGWDSAYILTDNGYCYDTDYSCYVSALFSFQLFDQGGSSGGSSPPVSPLASDIGQAIQILQDKPDCAALFGNPTVYGMLTLSAVD